MSGITYTFPSSSNALRYNKVLVQLLSYNSASGKQIPSYDHTILCHINQYYMYYPLHTLITLTRGIQCNRNCGYVINNIVKLFPVIKALLHILQGITNHNLKTWKPQLMFYKHPVLWHALINMQWCLSLNKKGSNWTNRICRTQMF